MWGLSDGPNLSAFECIIFLYFSTTNFLKMPNIVIHYMHLFLLLPCKVSKLYVPHGTILSKTF